MALKRITERRWPKIIIGIYKTKKGPDARNTNTEAETKIDIALWWETCFFFKCKEPKQ